MQAASPANLAGMLKELANLATNEESIRRPTRKWPGFIPEAPRNPRITVPDYEHLPADLHHVIVLREEARLVWSRNPSQQLESLLLSGGFAFGRPFDGPPMRGIVGVDWRRGQLIYRPQNLLQEVLNYLLSNMNNARICANPECPAPYFLGARSRYCSTDCSAAIQAAAKRAWWREHGQDWRQSRRKSAW